MKKSMRVTIKDIAKACGLSTTAVSLVLNGKGKKISSEHTELILKIAKEMNYRPNQLAVSLVKRKTYTLGLIVPDITNIFFSELAKGIGDAGREDGYNLILCNTNDKHKLELEYVNTLADKGVDGILIAMSAESYGERGKQSIKFLKNCNIPVVIVDCFNEQTDFSSISVDNEKGAYMAVEHLISLGHTRIACVTGPTGPQANEDRFLGYKNAIRRYNIKFEENLIYEGDFRFYSGVESVEYLLPHKPTAIFCLNDLMAYGVIGGLKKHKIKIPKEMSVVGFDDVFFSDIMDIPLTTVQQPVYELGKKAVELLQDEINNKIVKKINVFLEPKLIVRSSTRKMV